MIIRDNTKLTQLVKARDCQSRGRRFDSDKNSKTWNQIPSHPKRLASMLFHRNMHGSYNRNLVRAYEKIGLRTDHCTRKKFAPGGLLVLRKVSR